MSSDDSSRVFLADDVTLQDRQTGGVSGGMLRDGGTGKFYHVGSTETYLLGLIADGGCEVRTLADQIGSVEVDWTPEDLGRFIQTLTKAGLVRVAMAGSIGDSIGNSKSDRNQTDPWVPRGADDGDPAVVAGRGESSVPPPKTARGPTEPAGGAGARTGALPQYLQPLGYLISFRVPIGNFDRAAASAASWVGWLCHPVVVAINLIAIAAMMLVVAADHDRLSDQLTQLFDRGMWMPLLVVWMVAKIWHELGHAVAAKRMGVRIGNIGVMFFLMAPLAYVDVTDAWRLRWRSQRLAIAMAGVYFELIVSAIAAAVWWASADGLVSHLAAQIFVITGPATLLVNANPLLRLDGYYALSDLVDIPNMRWHGRGQLAAMLDLAISGAEPPQTLLSGWRRRFATAHAAASVVFQIVWMGGLIVAVAYMAGGLGIIIAAAAVLLWCVVPAGMYVVRRVAAAGGWRDHLRLMTSLATLVVAGQVVLSSTSPLARRVPVMVDDVMPQIARSPADAFVQEVLVHSGQSVQTGQTLMRLRNDSLRLQRSETIDELDAAQHDAVAARHRGELALSAAASQRAANLRGRLTKLNSQLADLNVVATRDGQVTTPRLSDMRGRFVSAGDALLTVADPSAKSIVASVDDQSVTAYETAAAAGRPVAVRLRGGRTVGVVPAPLRPSSTRKLPHATMSAAAGGPIPVRPTDDGEMESVAVRTESRCHLSPIASLRLSTGQIGSMRIGDDRTIGARLWDWVSEGL